MGPEGRAEIPPLTGRFVLRRCLQAIPVLWGVLTLLFLLLHAMPGNPSNYFFHPELPADLADRVRANLGLDQPLGVQYLKWLGSALRLDFQYSFISGRPVAELLGEALPRTVALAGAAILLAFLLGVPAGAFAALRHGSVWDQLIGGASICVVSMPVFFLGMLLILLLAGALPFFPLSGTSSVNADLWPAWKRWLDHLWHLALPALTLGLASAAAVLRFAREGFLDSLGQDFVRTARAKGLPSSAVLWRHAFPGTLLPVLTLFGLLLPMLFSGSVLVESLFGWHGMGFLIVEAILQRDYPVVLGTTFFLTVLVVIGSLLADLLCRAADPRIEAA